MIRQESAVDFHVGAWRTEVQIGTSRRIGTTQKLDLNRDGEILVFLHALCRLGMDHNSAVSEPPGWASDHLIPHEPVLHTEAIVREVPAIKEMAKPAFKRLVLVV